MPEYGQFEGKITPEKERELLSGQLAQSPEKAKEIFDSHFQHKPEQVYEPGFVYSPEEIAKMQAHVTDLFSQEKEGAMQFLFNIVDTKGVLNAVEAAQGLPPVLLDEFHDRLTQYFKVR